MRLIRRVLAWLAILVLLAGTAAIVAWIFSPDRWLREIEPQRLAIDVQGEETAIISVDYSGAGYGEEVIVTGRSVTESVAVYFKDGNLSHDNWQCHLTSSQVTTVSPFSLTGRLDAESSSRVERISKTAEANQASWVPPSSGWDAAYTWPLGSTSDWTLECRRDIETLAVRTGPSTRVFAPPIITVASNIDGWLHLTSTSNISFKGEWIARPTIWHEGEVPSDLELPVQDGLQKGPVTWESRSYVIDDQVLARIVSGAGFAAAAIVGGLASQLLAVLWREARALPKEPAQRDTELEITADRSSKVRRHLLFLTSVSAVLLLLRGGAKSRARLRR